MAASSSLKFLLIFMTLCLIGITSTSAQLSVDFYNNTCPQAVDTIKNAVQSAVSNESRMGASLLDSISTTALFKHGCDASVLLDDTTNFTGEKNSFPNANSLRGFEVIDDIKSTLEGLCLGVVSCADILSIAARDAVVALGGQAWEVQLGRRDSTTASLDESNSDLPAPFLDLDGLITAFAKKNFSASEMVTLSGAHTMGLVRCSLFRARIYNETNIDSNFATAMQQNCPFEGGDNNLSPFDSTTPFVFDNAFYINLVHRRVSYTPTNNSLQTELGRTDSQVSAYSTDMTQFKQDFANAMFKMTMLTPLTGSDGQIRQNCRIVNL